MDKSQPAFPHSYSDGKYTTDGGMTLRDYFASKVLQELIAHYGNPGSYDEAARQSYSFADAMLAARDA